MRVDPAPAQAPPTGSSAAFLLSSWWSRPVPEVVLFWRDQVDMATAVAEALGTDPTALPTGVEGPEELLEEYERLFVGPGGVPCPPYESYWREDVAVDIRRTLMGPCVPQLQRLYAALGLGLEGVPEMPDHIAIELEALGVALAAEDSGEVARTLLDAHTGSWTGRFCRAVAREAEQSHYRRLAQVTRDWLAALRTGLDAAPVANDGA